MDISDKKCEETNITKNITKFHIPYYIKKNKNTKLLRVKELPKTYFNRKKNLNTGYFKLRK